MSTTQTLNTANNPLPLEILRRGRELHISWYYSALGFLVLTLIFFGAQYIDSRLFYGASVWAKPCKFALSISVYFATLVAFVPFMPQGYFQTWRGKILTTIPVFAAVLEMGYIAYQASLGEASHFNFSTPFHAMMYSLMGVGAASMVAIFVWMAFSISRANSLSSPLVLAIVIGLLMSCALGGGFGSYLASQSGHWVGGAADDANGLVLMQWARDGGDLRVAHFFGMHAMQALPLFALLLPKKIPNNFSLALVVSFAVGYAAFSYTTFVQAIAGQPFLGY